MPGPQEAWSQGCVFALTAQLDALSSQGHRVLIRYYVDLKLVFSLRSSYLSKLSVSPSMSTISFLKLP